MSDTGKQSPLGVNVMSGLLQGKGFWVNNPTAGYVGSSTSSTDYTPGTIVNTSCLYWLTHSINLSYGNVSAETYANITTIGSSTIPALGNSPPPTYTYTGLPSWAGAGYTDEVSSWGYIRLFPWQGYNEFNYNNTLALSNMYNDFCGSFIASGSFIQQSNPSILTMYNALGFMEGTYSNMNDLITADVTNVSLSTGVFGRDLINLGKALDLSTIWTFGYPSNLLATLKKNNALTASLSVALLATGLSSSDIDQIANNTGVTKNQQQLVYSAFLIIAGVDLAEILVALNCNTAGLVTLADLLNVKKMFPNSYLTLTVPIYNSVPGPTNSKTYYPIYAVNTVNPSNPIPDAGGINSALSAPEIVATVGTIIPPLPPPYPYTDKESWNQHDVAALAQGRDGSVPQVTAAPTRTFRG